MLTATITCGTRSSAIDGEVAAGLLEDALAAVDQHDDGVGGRRAGDHVARVLHVAGAVGEDEAAVAGGEVAVGDVDRDALLALGAEAVGQQREVERRRARSRARRRCGRPARAGRRGSPSSRAAAGRRGSTCRRRPSRPSRSGTGVGRASRRPVAPRRGRCASGHQKYPSFLRSSIAASEMRSSARVAPRSVRVERAISATIDVEVRGIRFDRAGAAHVADRAVADDAALDGLVGARAARTRRPRATCRRGHTPRARARSTAAEAGSPRARCSARRRARSSSRSGRRARAGRGCGGRCTGSTARGAGCADPTGRTRRAAR